MRSFGSSASTAATPSPSLSGASLTTEKAYLMGKFAHVCLSTANIDYNGRLCMVSAGAGNKKAFGIDRAANPWTDILGADVDPGRRRERHRMRADHDELHLAGARSRRENHRRRSADHAARPHVRPVPAGQARTRHGAVQRRPAPMIRHDGSITTFIERTPSGSTRSPRRSRPGCRAGRPRSPASRRRASGKRPSCGARRRPASCCTRAAWSITATAWPNVLSAINIVLASGRIGRQDAVTRTITGQGNGQGGREHGQKCDQLPGNRDIENPEHRAHIARVWGIDAEELPQPASTRTRSSGSRSRRDQGPAQHLLQPGGVPARQQLRAAGAREARFLLRIDFFLSETARYADVVLPGSLQEEDEGTVYPDRGARHQDQPGREPPGRRHRLADHPGLAHGLGRERGFTFGNPGEIFEELRVASKGGVADYSGITYERIEPRRRLLAVPGRGADGGAPPGPRVPRALRAGLVESVAQAPAVLLPRRQGPLQPRRRTEGRPRTSTTTTRHPDHRPSGEPVPSGNQTRRIGPLVDHYPEPRLELHPRLAAKLGIADGDWVTVESRRGR